jgi:hypothetical protein
MYGLTRGTLTLIGIAVSGLLIWIGTSVLDPFDENADVTTGEYWWAASFIALAGLTIALSQLLGGWTKWGWPRVSGSVFLLGFIPALIAGGWIVAAAEGPLAGDTSSWLGEHVTNWSDDIGIEGLVGDLIPAWAAFAFGVGLVFGLTFDTTGPRTEPILRRRRAVAAGGAAPSNNGEASDRGVRIREGDTRAAPQPEPPPQRGAPTREE